MHAALEERLSTDYTTVKLILLARTIFKSMVLLKQGFF